MWDGWLGLGSAVGFIRTSLWDIGWVGSLGPPTPLLQPTNQLNKLKTKNKPTIVPGRKNRLIACPWARHKTFYCDARILMSANLQIFLKLLVYMYQKVACRTFCKYAKKIEWKCQYIAILCQKLWKNMFCSLWPHVCVNYSL